MSGTMKSLAHCRWECKYPVVFIPKSRRKASYGEVRQMLGEIFHEPARQGIPSLIPTITGTCSIADNRLLRKELIMPGRLAGKVALVSGGASGIGAAHVRIFAVEGAKVIAGDIQEEMGKAVVGEVRRGGGEATFVRLDVSKESDWAHAVREAVSRYGKLTTLINNAGIYWPQGIEAETLEKWNKMIAVNQTGVWLGMKAAVPEMRRAGGGAIVNISSLYGIIGSPSSISYHASKGAVRIMSKAAALEYARQGIRVNSIHPGQIETPILAGLTPEQNEQIKAATPVGRMGKPEEIAYGSLYLCSDEAAYTTGIELIIDGGWSAQ
jgi:NAD(P)-dependent dehydrogenase (short-subunit alcohol dehydrogenase family)